MKMDFICKESQLPETDDVGVSDNENSEDEQLEHAAWQDVDLTPAYQPKQEIEGFVDRIVHDKRN